MHGGGGARRPPEAWELVGQFHQPPCQPYQSAHQQQAYQPLYQPTYQPSNQPQYQLPFHSQYQQHFPLPPLAECQSQASYQQTSCQSSCQASYQVPYQSDCQPLYSRHWGEDLYSMTELALGEVSPSDDNCPVCQRDRHLTRHRGPREQLLTDWRPTGDPPLLATTPAAASASAAAASGASDTVSRILVSSNSSLAAIYFDVRFVPTAKAASSGFSASAPSMGATTRSRGPQQSPWGSSAAPVTGYQPLLTINGRDRQSDDAVNRQGGGATTSSVSSTAASSAPSLRLPPNNRATGLPLMPPPPPPPPPLPPPARSAARPRDPVSQSTEGSSDGPPQSTKPASEFESVTSGTPGPWTPGSGTPASTPGPPEATSAEGESAAPGSTSAASGMQPGGGSDGGPQGQPYKTTIQLLRFMDRDAGQGAAVPKRIQPPMFLSRHQPENVVTGRAKRPPPPPLPLAPLRLPPERGNYSNSAEAAAESLLPSDVSDRQKHLVASAIHLTRLIESSWGQL